ncbi:MAG: hypothetical protein JNJ57_01075 [Saprospiraceae bacterium]|nr:hypothetical protein [Saprospiraceae bacterium]
MKQFPFLKMSAACVLFFLLSGALSAQKLLLLKGGPGVRFGNGAAIGFDAGIEIQLGEKSSCNLTLGYLKNPDVISKTEAVAKLNGFGSLDDFNSAVTFSVDFRFYTQRNLLAPLQGFYFSLGGDVLPSKISRYSATSNTFLREVLYQETGITAGVGIGFAKNLNDKTSIDVGIGPRLLLVTYSEIFGQDNGALLIPLKLSLRYQIN